MKIVNFIRKEAPKKFFKFWTLATFDIEITCPTYVIQWVGWSIREGKEGNRYLQGPILLKSSAPDGTRSAVQIKGVTPEFFLSTLRARILKEHNIEIKAPKKWVNKNDGQKKRFSKQYPKKVRSKPDSGDGYSKLNA